MYYQYFKKFFQSKEATVAIEYGLAVALLAFVIGAGMTDMGGNIKNYMEAIAS